MAITTVSQHVVSVNAIQGTLIADNAITAVHIATNAVSGTLIADNAVTATHIAQNTITVTQIADDAIEAAKLADGIITTNHLNKAMISSQTEVTPVAGDFVLIGDTSDSNNLKKAPLSGVAALGGVDGISSSADATAITIDSSERVGIGDSSPDNDLNVQGSALSGRSASNSNTSLTLEHATDTGIQFFSATQTQLRFGDAASTAAGSIIYSHSDNILRLSSASAHRFTIGGTEAVRINSSGEVGIGTDSPAEILHTSTSANNVGRFTSTDATAYIQINDSDDSLYITTAGQKGSFGGNASVHADNLNVDFTNGRVGIGTTSPANNLHIHTDSGGEGLTIKSTGDTSNAIIIDANRGNAGAAINQLLGKWNGTDVADIIYLTGSDTTNKDDGIITFRTSSADNIAERMRIAADGKVGIGQASPSADLHITGSGDTKIIIEDGSDEQFITAHSGGLNYGVVAGDSHTFVIDGADKMVVNSDGILGVGTTDFTAMGSSSYKGIKVGGAVLQDSGGGTGSATYLGNNSYVGGSNNFYHDSGGTCSGIQLTSGDINFYTFDGGGGSADAQWSPGTPRMHVKENGQIGIGTTTMLTNAKLTVDGGDMMVQGANNSCGISDLLPGYTRGDYGVIYSTANHIYFKVGSSYISYINGGDGTFNVSDSRIKENIATLTGTLDKVKQLRGVSFTWKDTEERGTDTKIGLIAQEVEAVYPQLVDDGALPKDNEGNDPLKSVNYAHLTSVLIEALKELDTKLTAAEARIKTLEDA